MSNKTSFLFAALVLAFAGAATAADKAAGVEAIRAAFPGLNADEVHATPVDGWYEIMLGSQVAYVSADAKYVMRGDLIELETNNNYTEMRRNNARVSLLNSVPEEDAIVFAPEKVEHSITVFTDIDCGYCRKLHAEIDELEGMGVKVTYLFFPRAGPGSASWDKAESVWCADDRNVALTAAKAGDPVAPKQCGDASIQAQYQMGRKVGLRGTPAIVTENGELIAGYLPSSQLVARLKQAEKTAASAAASASK